MTEWDAFFKERVSDIFTTSSEVIDIGGSLRIDEERGNRTEKKNEWVKPLAQKISYKILDPVPDYNPDIIGDIHELPFKDDSVEAFLCLAVLEHVENPVQAMKELHRTLKPGGKLMIYVPFLYYYHAHEGYYGDYWRFTIDTLKLFGKDFSESDIRAVRLPVETLCRLTPFGRFRVAISLSRFLDGLLYKGKSSRQVSGYYLYLVK